MLPPTPIYFLIKSITYLIATATYPLFILFILFILFFRPPPPLFYTPSDLHPTPVPRGTPPVKGPKPPFFLLLLLVWLAPTTLITYTPPIGINYLRIDICPL